MISLDGAWKLYYHLEDGELPRVPAELTAAGWDCIDATVPGNVELDLYRAGKEDDPFFGENIYNFRKYEFYSWWFTRKFDVPKEYKGEKCVLTFEGLDTYARVFVNDILVGESANMLIAHSFDVTKALNYGGENTIHVDISSAINKVRDKDSAIIAEGETNEYTLLRKPSSSFGWDIMGRFLSAGMWRSVHIDTVKKDRLTQVYIAPSQLNADGSVLVDWRVHFTSTDLTLSDLKVRISGKCGDSEFVSEKTALFTSINMSTTVKNAKLWWPAGYGEQNLYDVKTELIYKGEVVDTRCERIGLRLFRIEHVLKPGDEGEFKIFCNNVPILAKGSNWVPMDALHSRDAGRYQAALYLFRDCGCNIVRCWGGNVYEDHRFFDLCDEYGIMVWQDFGMACATYEYTEEFKKIIEEEATFVVRKLRNHASILLWAGDNECDEKLVGWAGTTPTYSNRHNELTRELLPHVIRMNDPYRVFLPSSPYIPEGIARYDVPEQHNWGARAYFKDDFYKHSSAHFISECGYHGCPAVSSLKKYIPEDKLTPWLNNSVWDTHNTDYLLKEPRGYNRIQLMHDQVRIFFGEEPTDLLRFSHLSQIVQAEAKKFFVERTRLKKWRRTGIIWWNMIDGWPQISDAVVDYYYAKKLAYNYIKRIQKPVCLMMDEIEGWNHDVVLGNDSRTDCMVCWQVIDGDTDEVLLSGETLSKANENIKVGAIREMSGEQKLYILKWSIDGKEYANHYLSGFPHFDGDKVLDYVEKIMALPESFTWED